jgi:hypothetical protein
MGNKARLGIRARIGREVGVCAAVFAAESTGQCVSGTPFPSGVQWRPIYRADRQPVVVHAARLPSVACELSGNASRTAATAVAVRQVYEDATQVGKVPARGVNKLWRFSADRFREWVDQC